MILGGFALLGEVPLLAALAAVAAAAPFRHMVTPGGFTMSVAMPNCGVAGWVTDRRGYRYAALDPEGGGRWPAMPSVIDDLARREAAAAGYSGFAPDACLIDCYAPGARLSLHQDRNERDLGASIVSVSLGLPATFLFGGQRRGDPQRRVELRPGDVAIWGGPAWLALHGVLPLDEGEHLVLGRRRLNLTFRKAFRRCGLVARGLAAIFPGSEYRLSHTPLAGAERCGRTRQSSDDHGRTGGGHYV